MLCRNAWNACKGKGKLDAMMDYVILVDETFQGFTPDQQAPGGLEVPTTSTLAGAERQEPEQVRCPERIAAPGAVHNCRTGCYARQKPASAAAARLPLARPAHWPWASAIPRFGP